MTARLLVYVALISTLAFARKSYSPEQCKEFEPVCTSDDRTEGQRFYKDEKQVCICDNNQDPKCVAVVGKGGFVKSKCEKVGKGCTRAVNEWGKCPRKYKKNSRAGGLCCYNGCYKIQKNMSCPIGFMQNGGKCCRVYRPKTDSKKGKKAMRNFEKAKKRKNKNTNNNNDDNSNTDNSQPSDPEPKTALLLVDIQKCFVAGGSLPVTNALNIVPKVNQLIAHAQANNWTIFASKDWHPANHISFYSNRDLYQAPSDAQEFGVTTVTRNDGSQMEQALWPDHCTQNNADADFVDGLNVPSNTIVIKKGQTVDLDSYSAFYDNLSDSATELPGKVTEMNIEKMVIVGIATDFCVNFSILDAVDKMGLEVETSRDMIAGVFEDKSNEAIQAWLNKGVTVHDTVDEIVG